MTHAYPDRRSENLPHKKGSDLSSTETFYASTLRSNSSEIDSVAYSYAIPDRPRQFVIDLRLTASRSF